MINITKIAKNNIKYNKSKSILIILTIFLATTLLSSVAMVGLDWTEVNKRNVIQYYGSYHGLYGRVDETKYEKIKSHADIDSTGIINGIGSMKEYEEEVSNERVEYTSSSGKVCSVDENGKVLGEHKGIIRYTVGQRKGLGLALPHPMYVKEKNLEENKVILCENEALFSKELTATDVNLISTDRIEGKMRVSARVRYNQKEQPATVTQPDGDRIRVVFDEPQRAVCKGQAVVLYDGDTVVGGGVIE